MAAKSILVASMKDNQSCY